MIAGLLSLALATSPIYTPGAVRSDLALRQMCAVKWGHDRRFVDAKMRAEVARRYGMQRVDPKRYELDHLIPRSLLGADDADNLWPQRWPAAYKKDARERALSKAVCAGTISLKAAQDEMRHWGR